MPRRFPWSKKERVPPEAAEGESERKSLKESVLLFGRDLAVAFLIVAIVLGILFAYTQVWPPMVVVESDSMQHADAESFVGVIDTGDLVLVQGVRAPTDVTTWVEGRASGHQTYSNSGDVIIFHYPGQPLEATPIIHRAVVYVVHPSTTGAGVDVPSLELIPGNWTGTWVNESAATTPYGLASFKILNVPSWSSGFQPQVLAFNVAGVTASGFLTKGDHNTNADPWGPVPLSRVLGRARGEMPWFGLIKLTLGPGPTGCCPDGWGDRRAPPNSWDALLISLVAIIVGPFLADYGWAYWKERRKVRVADREPREPQDVTVDEPEPTPPPPPAETPPEPEELTDEARRESSGPGAGGP